MIPWVPLYQVGTRIALSRLADSSPKVVYASWQPSSAPPSSSSKVPRSKSSNGPWFSAV